MKRAIFIAGAASLLFAACEKNPTPPLPPPDDITVTGVTVQKELELVVGATETLTAGVLPENATHNKVSWKSDDETIATVTDGEVKGVKDGTTTITVTTEEGNFKETCVVKVSPGILGEGTTGELAWRLTTDRILTIDGNGPIPDYNLIYNIADKTFSTDSPWVGYKNMVITIKIGDGVTRIGNNAFSDFTSRLKNVTLPGTLEAIGESVFKRCQNLKEIAIPASVKSIGGDAFSYCYGLTSLTIPDGVESLGDRAFYDCRGLLSVSIPGSVQTFGTRLFYYCTALTRVTIMAAIPPALADGSFMTGNEKTLVVPSGSAEAYRNDTSWSGVFTTIIEQE